MLFLFILATREFLEARCRALRRYLVLICRHPVLHDSEIVMYFLTVGVSVSLCFRNLFLIMLLCIRYILAKKIYSR